MESPQHRRTLVALIAAVSCFMLFMTTERCFEQADRRNAIEMVRGLRAHDGAMTIPEALAQRHPSVRRSDYGWHATVTDKYYGFIRVQTLVPESADAVEYLFDINLAGQRLHPANERAKSLMRELGNDAAGE